MCWRRTCLLLVLAAAWIQAMPTDDTLVVAKTEKPVSSTPVPVEEATTEQPLLPLKTLEMLVRSDVALRYAHTSVVTRVRNPAARAQEATFRVLLPDTAFITGFVMTLNGTSYKAYVKEKEEAKQIYNTAVSQGVGAAHIATKARDSNHFTVSINVEPQTEALFNLTYEELLLRRNGVYNHAINLHPGRVVPKMEVKVYIKESQKITALRVPEIKTGNEVDATEDDNQNPIAKIDRGHDDREATITFTPNKEEQERLMTVYAEKSKESMRNRSPTNYWYGDEAPREEEAPGALGQFVVQYDVNRPENGEILVNDGYFVHFFAPAALPALPKHVVFVLDVSGSMSGRKIEQLKQAMHSILAELREGDYFNIVAFSTSAKVHDLKEAEEDRPVAHNSWFEEERREARLVPPSQATKDNIGRANTIIDRLIATGGTNIAYALDVAVALAQRGTQWTPAAANSTTDMVHQRHSQYMSQGENTTAEPVETTTKVDKNVTELNAAEPMIIFLTDGDPTVGESDPKRIINRLSEKNYGPRKSSIFSLAFGEDADRSFLRKLSLRNDGFMRHIYEAADAPLQLHDFYRQVSSPLLADVTFNYPQDQISKSDLTKSKFRTFFRGGEAVVAGKMASGVTELEPEVTATGQNDKGSGKRRIAVTTRSSEAPLPLERLWAFLTVRQLLDRRDADADTVPLPGEEKPEKKALALALKYEFVTPLTSLVVVKPNATKAVDAESVDNTDKPVAQPYPAYPSSLGLSGYGGASLSFSGVARPQAFYENLGLRLYFAGSNSRRSYHHAPSASRSSLRYSHNAPSHSANYYRPYPAPSGGGTGLHQIMKRIGFVGFKKDFVSSEAQFSAPQQGTDDEESRLVGGLQSTNLQLPNPNTLTEALHEEVEEDLLETEAFATDDDRSAAISGLPESASISSSLASTTMATPPLPLPPAVQPSPLADFPWAAPLLDAATNTLKLDVNNTVVQMKLAAQNEELPTEESSCDNAVDGAEGVCMYLTRCGAAKQITLHTYLTSYCLVPGGYAGVCCPKPKTPVS